MSNIIEESDIFNELLNWAHEGASDAIKQEDIEEVSMYFFINGDQVSIS
jgi:hypothetical protein